MEIISDNLLIFLNEVHTSIIVGFPEDEAASLETLTFRQSNAPNLFLGVEYNDRIVAVSQSFTVNKKRCTGTE